MGAGGALEEEEEEEEAPGDRRAPARSIEKIGAMNKCAGGAGATKSRSTGAGWFSVHLL